MVDVIAEISGNHNGDIRNAMILIEAAKQAGADAVKLQLFSPEYLAHKRAQNEYALAVLGREPNDPEVENVLLHLYRRTVTPREWFPRLFKLAEEIGIEIFSSVFDPKDVPYLVDLGAKRLKIASFELGDMSLLRACDDTDLPVILSASLHSSLTLVGLTISCIENVDKLTILHATSYDKHKLAWPDYERFAKLRQNWPDIRFGLSDHTANWNEAKTMVELGAQMIEAHLALPEVETPDSEFSYSPRGFAKLVSHVKRSRK